MREWNKDHNDFKKTAIGSNLLSTKGTTNFAWVNRWYDAEFYKGKYIFILTLIS